MLWKRKLYKKRLLRNETKRVRKHYFKNQDLAEGGDAAPDGLVDDKKKEFYRQLFEKTGDEEVIVKKKKNKKPKV